MMAANLVGLKSVAQDGVRVKASASSGSFRRKGRLQEYLRMAREQVELLAQEVAHPDGQRERGEQAARHRAARERERRVEEALANLEHVQAAKERQVKTPRREKVSEARASTTDPEARVMKMPDGGFRPAYNVQVATDVDSGVIVGVAVSNRGTDQGEAPGMERQVAGRTGKHPDQYLMDNGFVNLEQIAEMERSGVEVYAPPKARGAGTGARTKEPGEVANWRARMSTEEGKELYRQRCSSAEWANAEITQRYGVWHLLVRGLAKATSFMLLVVIAHNLLRWMALAS